VAIKFRETGQSDCSNESLTILTGNQLLSTSCGSTAIQTRRLSFGLERKLGWRQHTGRRTAACMCVQRIALPASLARHPADPDALPRQHPRLHGRPTAACLHHLQIGTAGRPVQLDPGPQVEAVYWPPEAAKAGKVGARACIQPLGVTAGSIGCKNLAAPQVATEASKQGAACRLNGADRRDH